MNRLKQRISLAATALLLNACGGGDSTAPPPPPPPPPPAVTYTITMAPATVAIGGSVPRTAAVKDGSGTVSTPTLTWSSENPSVATVSAAGLVTGVTAGTVTLRASANGATGSTIVTVMNLAATDLFVGSRSGCAHIAGSALYCWGNNGAGVIGSLGDDEICYVDLPCSTTPRVGVSAPLFTQLTMGAAHTCGITGAGIAYCWGRNDGNQLGAASSESCRVLAAALACSHAPVLVEGGHTFTVLSVGSEGGQTCGLTADGEAWCWGSLPTSSIRAPVAVPGSLSFTSVLTGTLHTCGLTAAGTAYCWGASDLGPIGTSGAASPNPAAVSGGLVFTLLSAAYDHTCGIASTGAAYCWGANASGQLGDGTTTTRAAPTAVAGGISFATISAGHDHTCGVTPAGKAYCWGANEDAGGNQGGQLGDGSKTSRLTPVPVSGGLTFAEVQATRNFTCGRTTSGRIYCWGGNRYGNLGIGAHGDFDFVTTPVGLAGLP
jgi:alpha-tubulin suppressor-like RCC1 family protein